MSEREMQLTAVAHRMWSVTTLDAGGADDVLLLSDLLFARLEAGLRRWIGAEGYASLLTRSIADVVPLHPALATIPNLVADETELPPSTTPDGPAQHDAVIALLVAMLRQLGGIIGDNMAVRLIEQSGTPSPRGAAGAAPKDSTS